jgi:hypothetical protein
MAYSLEDLFASAKPSAYIRKMGLTPDFWQETVLDDPAQRQILNCARQVGKSTIVGGMAAWQGVCVPNSLVLMVAPSERQSQELLRKTRSFIDWNMVSEIANAAKLIELDNGSRIVALPGTERTIRGFSAPALLILEEAAEIPDELFHAVMPMMATARRGKIIALSTPKGKRGFFWNLWQGGDGWKHTQITVNDCPRITAEWIEERKANTPAWIWQQEYECEFVDTDTQVFSSFLLQRMLEQGQGGDTYSLGIPDIMPLEKGVIDLNVKKEEEVVNG